MNKPLRCFAAALLAVAASSPAAFAQAPKAQALETNIEGVTAEVVEAVRKDGVLGLKVRFRNNGDKKVRVRMGKVQENYVVAGSTKMAVLMDSQKVPLMASVSYDGSIEPEVAPHGSYVFWAKYPAPPAEAKKVTFYTAAMPPVDDIPITEGK